MEQGGGRQLDVLKYLLCLAAALIGFGLLRLSRRERRDMALLDRGGTPRDGERFAVCGTIEPEGEPFESPVRNKPAALYHFSVYHLEQRRRNTTPSEVVDFAGYGAMPFRVAGTRIGGFPILHEFDVKGIEGDDVRKRMKEHLRFAPLEQKNRGEIEWIHVPEPDLWDGVTRVARTFTRGEGRPMEECRFNETVVAPGEKACAIGVWSAERNALVATKGQDLWLYRGAKEGVRETLKLSVGCGWVLGVLLILAAIAGAVYLAGLF